VLPADVDEFDPFVVAIRRIEQEGGRMIQAQIRLLKDGVGSLGAEQCEEIMEAKQAAVDAAFDRFLQWLAGDQVQAPQSWSPLGAFGASMPMVPFMDAATFLRGLAGGSAQGPVPAEEKR
jgi:hypothetical protein